MPTYSFLTTKNFRHDVTAKNPKQAHKKALEDQKQWKEEDIEIWGLITSTYITYINGMASVYSWKVLK